MKELCAGLIATFFVAFVLSSPLGIAFFIVAIGGNWLLALWVTGLLYTWIGLLWKLIV